MPNLHLSGRRRHVRAFIKSAASLVLLFFVSGCNGCLVDAPVTASQVLNADNLSLQAMQILRDKSSAASSKLTTNYRDLIQFLNQDQFSAPRVREMEQRRSDMLKSANDFRAALKNARQNADALFKLLDKQAQQVTTANLKLEMENRAAQKRNEFNLEFDVATGSLQQLDAYIKQYNDILTHLREHTPSPAISGYVTQAGTASLQVEKLNDTLATAIDHGVKVLDPGSLTQVSTAPAASAPRPETVTATPAAVPELPAPPVLAPVSAPASSESHATSPPATAVPAPARHSPSTKKTSAHQPVPVEMTPASSPNTVQLTLLEGMPVMVRLLAPIPFGPSSEKTFTATLASALTVNGILVAGPGSEVHGRITEAQSSPGSSDYQMRLALSDITLSDKNRLAVSTQLLVTNNTAGKALPSGAVFRFPLARAVPVTLPKAR